LFVGLATVCVGALASAVVRAGPVETIVDVALGAGTPPAMVARYANGGGGLIFNTEPDRRWRL
jgi:hypothetical protein